MSEAVDLEVESIRCTFENFHIERDADDYLLEILPYPDLDGKNIATVKLSLSNMAGYPDVPMCIRLVGGENLDAKNTADINDIVREVTESHEGFELLYDLYTEVMQYLRTHNTRVLSVHDRLCGIEDTSQEIETNVEANAFNRDPDLDLSTEGDGEFVPPTDIQLCDPKDRVSADEFKAWSERFRREMIDNGIWRIDEKNESRLTGREIFMTNACRLA